MAKKLITERPTGPNDYAWSYYATYSREKFVETFPANADVDSSMEIILKAILSLIPGVGYILTGIDVGYGLSSNKAKTMLNNIRDFLIVHTSCIGVQISIKFVSTQKDGQWFWVPGNDYDVVYLYD